MPEFDDDALPHAGPELTVGGLLMGNGSGLGAATIASLRKSECVQTAHPSRANLRAIIGKFHMGRRAGFGRQTLRERRPTLRMAR